MTGRNPVRRGADRADSELDKMLEQLQESSETQEPATRPATAARSSLSNDQFETLLDRFRSLGGSTGNETAPADVPQCGEPKSCLDVNDISNRASALATHSFRLAALEGAADAGAMQRMLRSFQAGLWSLQLRITEATQSGQVCVVVWQGEKYAIGLEDIADIRTAPDEKLLLRQPGSCLYLDGRDAPVAGDTAPWWLLVHSDDSVLQIAVDGVAGIYPAQTRALPGWMQGDAPFDHRVTVSAQQDMPCLNVSKLMTCAERASAPKKGGK